ncbi:MAG: hypothetical protein SFV32_13120 [Opitutaceae bacterium]|nr:hypothetical protein [Opitutaceae bacterium]
MGAAVLHAAVMYGIAFFISMGVAALIWALFRFLQRFHKDGA